MPDPVVPNNESQTTLSSPQGLTPPADGAVPTTPLPTDPPEPFRFKEDHPVAWQRGRTADEVGEIANQMYGSMVGGTQPPAQMAPQQPPQQQYTYNQPVTPDPSIQGTTTSNADPVWDDMNPQASVQAQITQAQNQMAPQFQQQAAAMGGMARQVAEMKDPDSFNRWGPEIHMELNRLQPNMQTAENISTVVGIVRGRHSAELVAEAEAKVRAEYVTGDTRPDGSPGISTGASGVLDLDSQVVSPMYKDLLAKHKITEATLRETFAKFPNMYAGDTFQAKVENWLAAANKGDIVTEAAFQTGV